MEPRELAKSYDQIADHWVSDEFNRDNGMEAHRRAIAFLSDRGYALDVGCGSSGRFLDLFIDEGFSVEGIDISEEMISLARKRHPQVSFYHDDIVSWELPRKYSLISGWDSVWHLPLASQVPVMKKLCDSLEIGGVYIFTTGGLDAEAEKVDSNMGVPVSYSVLGIPQTLELLTKFGCVCRHLEYDQFPEPEGHVYIIAQKTEQVSADYSEIRDFLGATPKS